MKYHVVALLALLVAGCSRIEMVSPPESVRRPYDPTRPTYELAVEPIPFIADLDYQAEMKLCRLPYASSDPAFNIVNAQRLSDCQGVQKCYRRPAEGDFPERDEIVYTGPKFPVGHSPQDLAAQLTSALGGIENIKLKSSVGGHANGRNRSFLIRAQLTEFNVTGDGGSQGFGGVGVGPLAIFSLISVERTYLTGYVRIDVRIVEPTGQRILAAFPVAASATDGYISDTGLSGNIFEKDSFVPLLMQQATRAAMNEAASRIFRELGKL